MQCDAILCHLCVLVFSHRMSAPRSSTSTSWPASPRAVRAVPLSSALTDGRAKSSMSVQPQTVWASVRGQQYAPARLTQVLQHHRSRNCSSTLRLAIAKIQHSPGSSEIHDFWPGGGALRPGWRLAPARKLKQRHNADVSMKSLAGSDAS